MRTWRGCGKKQELLRVLNSNWRECCDISEESGLPSSWVHWRKEEKWDLEGVKKLQLLHTVQGQRLGIHNSDTSYGMCQSCEWLVCYCCSVTVIYCTTVRDNEVPLVFEQLIPPMKLLLVLRIQRNKPNYFYVDSSPKPQREQKLNELLWGIFSSLSPVSLGKCIIWWAHYLCIFIVILFRAQVKHSKGWVKRRAIAEKAIWLQMKDLVKWIFYAASFYKEKGKCSAYVVPLIFIWLNLEELGWERNSVLRVYNSLWGCLTWVMGVLCKQCFKESTINCWTITSASDLRSPMFRQERTGLLPIFTVLVWWGWEHWAGS